MEKTEYKLSAEEHEDIFHKIKSHTFRNAASVEYPAMVIIGGQPGCGKTGLIVQAKTVFENSKQPLVIINGARLLCAFES